RRGESFRKPRVWVFIKRSHPSSDGKLLYWRGRKSSKHRARALSTSRTLAVAAARIAARASNPGALRINAPALVQSLSCRGGGPVARGLRCGGSLLQPFRLATA